jgi:hypothetical protein
MVDTSHRLCTTASSVYSELPYIISGGRLLHPQPQDALCHGDRDSLNMEPMGHQFKRHVQMVNLVSGTIIKWLTPWIRVVLENLIVTDLVKKLPTFYGNRRFITVFTRARHWSLFWARLIHSTPSHPISLRFILLLLYHIRQGHPIGLFPSVFQQKYFRNFSYFPCVLHVPPE